MEEPFNLRLIVIFGCFVSGGRGKGRRSGPSPVPLLLWRNGDLTLEQRHLYRSGSWETKLIGETPSAIGIFKQALQNHYRFNWYFRKWGILTKLEWTLEDMANEPSSTSLWIRMDSLSVHATPSETGRSDRTSRISKVGIFNEDKGTGDNSEHQSGSNPKRREMVGYFF